MSKDESAAVKTARINMMGSVLVALFALVGTLAGLYFNAQRNKPEPTPIPATSAPQIVAPSTTIVSTDTPLPVASPSLALTATETVTPPPTATPTLVPKTLADGCIFAQTWKFDSTDENVGKATTVDAGGCYSTDLLGIFAKPDGRLEISNGNQKTNVASGIYVPIKNNSVIEFNVYITTMYIVYPEQGPAYVTFAIAPADKPMDARNTARFKLAVEKNESKPVIFFVEAKVGDAVGIHEGSRHYVYKQTYHVKMQLDGNKVHVIVGNQPLDNDLTIPAGAKVFYIGYYLPLLANIDAQVTDLTIDGVKP